MPPLHAVLSPSQRQQGIPSKPKAPTAYHVRRLLAFAVPTLCDATATTLLNVGLFYTYASTYQMLRGTLVSAPLVPLPRISLGERCSAQSCVAASPTTPAKTPAQGNRAHF